MTKLVFDTNVCGRIEASPRRGHIIRVLRFAYEIAASANTLMELLFGLCRSDDNSRFADDQERFRVAIGSTATGSRLTYPLETVMSNTTFLDFPVEFAFEKSCGLRMSGNGVGARRYREYTEVVLAATTLVELKTAVQWPPNPLGLPRPISETRFIKCDVVEADLRRGKYNYSTPLNEAKANDLYVADRLSWVKALAQFYNVSVNERDADSLAKGLDAVYEYQRSVWEMSRRGSFRPEKNENDWIDMNQLFYLADSTVEFITADEKIRSRCSASLQAQRILALQEMLDREGLAL